MDNGASSYRRFLAGQDEGLREIIDLYYDGLSLYLNTYLDNLTDAEDCAEEAMIVLATKKPHFSGNSSFKTWLYAIGRNLAIDRLRRKPPETEPLSEELVCGEYGQRSAEVALLEQEERERLLVAMNDLKPDYRRVLTLKFYYGMELCDIAKVMGKSSAGIYHLFERAKKSLRMKLGSR